LGRIAEKYVFNFRINRGVAPLSWARREMAGSAAKVMKLQIASLTGSARGEWWAVNGGLCAPNQFEAIRG
jgi:hypothetical protein